MLSLYFNKIKRFDWLLAVSVFLLFLLGLSAIYSVGLNQEFVGMTNFHKQVIFGLIGFLAFFILGVNNYNLYRVYAKVFWLAMIVLLVFVLFFGQTVNGTKGWFFLFGLGLQPVEVAKVALVAVLARFFSNRFQHFFVSKHIIVSLVFVLTFVLPVILQPDFGSALVLLGVWFITLILTGVKKTPLLILLLLGVLATSLTWGFFLQDYQKDRIKVFFNPLDDPLGSGYNVAQSIIAIGSGNFFGRGLGFGSQSQLKFIPEAQTDFIFAVIAEELGFLGVAVVFVLFGIIFWRLTVLAKTAADDFGQFLIIGIMSVLLIHLTINIGMNLGVMPVMGISLPFVSYGGSFLITCFMLMGLAESVAIKR